MIYLPVIGGQDPLDFTVANKSAFIYNIKTGLFS